MSTLNMDAWQGIGRRLFRCGWAATLATLCLLGRAGADYPPAPPGAETSLGSGLSGFQTPFDAGTLPVTGTDGVLHASDVPGGEPDPVFEVPGGGYGFLGQFGHIVGPTVGREDSITHIEFAPYVFHEETMLFGDVRFYRTNPGRTGGNFGLGLRHYLIDHDAILGAAFYYDQDESRKQTKFKQIGLSLELLTAALDVRANWYHPIEDTERVLGVSFVNGSQRFSGNQLLVDTRTDLGSAADGVDMLFSVPVPGEHFERFNLEASAGWYHYQVLDSDVSKIWGYKLRTDADVFDRLLHMFVEFTSDRIYKNNVVFGASVNYYHGFESRPRLHSRQFHRMSEWVRRNYTVVTVNDSVVTPGVAVRNPDTGDEYFFAHVRNIPGAPVPPPLPAAQPPFFNFPAPFGTGTVDQPFQFIQEAQNFLTGAPMVVRDNAVIYVHANSAYVGDAATVVLDNNQILLGEGVQQTLLAAGFATPLTLPTVVGGAVPVLQNSTADAISVGDNNTVAGFNIQTPGGNGLSVLGDIDGLYRDLTITGAAGDGVSMINPNGTFTLERVRVDGAAGVGFRVDGGLGMITVRDPDSDPVNLPTIRNAVNEAVLIRNTAGGFVNMQTASVNDNGGAGIRMINNIGNITIGPAMLSNTALSADPLSVGAGIEDRGNSGNNTLFGDVTIDNALGPGLLVQDLAAAGRFNVGGTVIINNRNDVGADFSNVNGTVQFSTVSSLTIGALNAAGAADPAIRFQGSSGDVILNDVTVADSLAEGILIGDPTGATANQPGASFIAVGNVSLASTAGPAIRIQGVDAAFDPTDVQFRNQVNINSRLNRGINIEDTAGPISFSGTTTVNNQNLVGTAALFVDNTTSGIGFGTFTANDNRPPEPAVDIQNVLAPGGVSFVSLNVLNALGTTGVEVDNANAFSTNGGTISVFDARAVDIETSTIQVILDSVSSVLSSPAAVPTDFGIRLVTNDGRFVITGDRVTLGSGGLIANATIAGLFVDDTDQIEINLQDYTANNIGVLVQNLNDDDTDVLELDQVRISNSVRQGVLANDVRRILIEDSFFTDNGLSVIDFGERQHIAIRVFTNPNVPPDLNPSDPNFDPFFVTIQRNTFSDLTRVVPGDAAVQIQTVGAAADKSRLDLFFTDNLIQPFDRDDVIIAGIPFRPAALDVSWDGELNADILRNVVTMGDGDGQFGFDIATQDALRVARINFNDNQITGGNLGDNYVGANFDFLGPANLTVARNTVNFPSDDAGNQGLRFRFLSGSNNVVITDNTLLLAGGTAMNFTQVTAPTNLLIEGNQLGSTTVFSDRGIFFAAVSGVIDLFGQRDNLVNVQIPVFQNIFSIPAGTSQGQILVNGVPVP
jgi:hypothetical protein